MKGGIVDLEPMQHTRSRLLPSGMEPGVTP